MFIIQSNIIASVVVSSFECDKNNLLSSRNEDKPRVDYCNNTIRPIFVTYIGYKYNTIFILTNSPRLAWSNYIVI